jgi:hypothetical protein
VKSGRGLPQSKTLRNDSDGLANCSYSFIEITLNFFQPIDPHTQKRWRVCCKTAKRRRIMEILAGENTPG